MQFIRELCLSHMYVSRLCLITKLPIIKLTKVRTKQNILHKRVYAKRMQILE